jgi:ferric-dicitrate binding protein FerR (iron transport regulator)
MSFQQEILAALQSGKGYPSLMEIVRRHYADKETGREAYESLEQLWRELGFQESDQESPLRDELEYVMERVWYFGANAS